MDYVQLASSYYTFFFSSKYNVAVFHVVYFFLLCIYVNTYKR